jgi:60 kDa SS-A/Ro ribonucleoprotein
MANPTLFSSLKSLPPRADTHNEAGARAYTLPPKHALAQLAATGCFNGTYYTSADTQCDTLLGLIDQVDDTVFLAKLAVYSRERAGMKDMPAALLVALSKRAPALMHRVFDRVVDSGRVLRTVFQMIRSGQFGRTCLSASLQRAFQRWLNEASVGTLLSASIGQQPSLRDVLRLARPTPQDNMRRALFGWLTDRETSKWAPATAADLPEQVQALSAYRQATTATAQVEILRHLSVRWDLLAEAAQGPEVWKMIARQMGPQALRMNLNTLLRHEVLQDHAVVGEIAQRLADAEAIRRSRQFPYQYFATYLSAHQEVPQAIKAALQQAAEIACGNIPTLPGPVVIGVDTSGSMRAPVTGWRGRNATTQVRCVDVAALCAAALFRRNPESIVIPFDIQAYDVRIEPTDAILSIAERLAQYGGGGTDCSIPLREANATYRARRFAGVVLISDTESWVYRDRPYATGQQGASGVMTEWQQFVTHQLQLGGGDTVSHKLVCIDLQPYGTTQAPDRADILNIGGFSDAVFQVVAAFLREDPSRFVADVEAITL